jgi:hypothetical protein
VGSPLLLDEGHVGGKVVVHVEVGALLVDDWGMLSVSMLGWSQSSGALTGGGCGHLCGYG